MKIAYKLMRQRKDGTLGPLFINRKQRVALGTTYRAHSYPTKGFALRPGWHCMAAPKAPHLKMKPDRVWVEVIMSEYEVHSRPASQGGEWFLAKEITAQRIL